MTWVAIWWTASALLAWRAIRQQRRRRAVLDYLRHEYTLALWRERQLDKYPMRN